MKNYALKVLKDALEDVEETIAITSMNASKKDMDSILYARRQLKSVIRMVNFPLEHVAYSNKKNAHLKLIDKSLEPNKKIVLMLMKDGLYKKEIADLYNITRAKLEQILKK